MHWVKGSSIGAVTSALIAGNRPAERVGALPSYWGAQLSSNNAGSPRHAFAWMSAISMRLLGSAGHFHPRLSLGPFHFRSLYDLSPTRERLKQLVDFGRLNNGEIRVTICTTHLKSGNAVMFDTARERVELDHVLASYGFLPEFAPAEINGRWLGDGGLSMNAPFDSALADIKRLRLYVIDLFARDGGLPVSLELLSSVSRTL